MKRKRLKIGNGGGGDATSERLQKRVLGGGTYFTRPKDKLQFISSGCKTLDLALGGGWAENRIFNIVGDKSTGKTLLCIEAMANFAKKYSKGRLRYAEAESAFDPDYAAALGMPVDRVDFGKPLETVEDLFEELERLCQRAKHPTLYILDSLDALSDRAEMERDIDQGSYGASKAKQMSELFRRLVQQLAQSKVTLGVVSQIRDKIGMTFGRQYSRSGGHALDFYASQIVYLAHKGTEERTISGFKRPVSIRIRAKTDKNKVGLPYRTADFEIVFGYGIDDYKACLTWLASDKSGAIKELGVRKDDIKRAAERMLNERPEIAAKAIAKAREVTERRWYEVETRFLPTRRKYT